MVLKPVCRESFLSTPIKILRTNKSIATLIYNIPYYIIHFVRKFSTIKLHFFGRLCPCYKEYVCEKNTEMISFSHHIFLLTFREELLHLKKRYNIKCCINAWSSVVIGCYLDNKFYWTNFANLKFMLHKFGRMNPLPQTLHTTSLDL